MPRILFRAAQAAMLIGIAAGALLSAPQQWNPIAPAAAQERLAVRADFRTVLEPFGAWRHHARFGDVWVPGHRIRAWRPYTVGHWVYSDDYGWYWVEDTQEADWGWIAYHYGRWYRDPDYGWCWIPGDEWAPAWVDWRQGDDYVGWAPEPPNQFAVEVDDDPGFWSFVTINNFVAPSIAAVLLPQPQLFFNRTFIVNRTVTVGDRGPRFAVNPGIPATFVASRLGRPLRTFDVRPRIIAGTANLRGATEVRAEDLRQQRGPSARRLAAETIVQPSRTTINPARSVQPPPHLARGEQGRLGTTPPLAARGQEGRQLSNAPTAQRPGGTAPPPTTAERRGAPGAATTGQQPNERRGERSQPGAAAGQPPLPNERRGAERLPPGTTGQQLNERRGERLARGAPPREAPTTGEAPRRPGNIEQGRLAPNARELRRPEGQVQSRERAPEIRRPEPPPTAERRPIERGAAASVPQHEVRPPVSAARPSPPPAAVARPSPPPVAAVHPSPPPAAAVHPSPPPAAAARPSPPPAAAAHPSPPPAAAARPTSPPAAAAHPPGPATTGAAPPGRRQQQ